jgi:hypothetical protein
MFAYTGATSGSGSEMPILPWTTAPPDHISHHGLMRGDTLFIARPTPAHRSVTTVSAAMAKDGVIPGDTAKEAVSAPEK